MAEAREAAKTEGLAATEARVEELSEKLKKARDSELQLEENYRQELGAQTKLAELYKGHCDESEGKAAELTAAVGELQGMLKESADRFEKQLIIQVICISKFGNLFSIIKFNES